MQTEILDASPASIARAAAMLDAGSIVAFPTETVYGLGARADRPTAVREIFHAKGRPADKPLILHVADVAQAKSCVVGWDARADALADRYWPGPVTIVLRAEAWVPSEVTAGGATVAVRAPGHEVALALIEACGCALAAPSANRSGDPPPVDAAGVVATLGGRIPVIVDAGETPVRTPSTLVSLVDATARIVREGAVPASEIHAVLAAR